VVFFSAEQGFAGAFSERVLDAVRADVSDSELFLVGTRGRQLVSKGYAFRAGQPDPSNRSVFRNSLIRTRSSILALQWANRSLDAVFSQWRPGYGIHRAPPLVPRHGQAFLAQRC
jgi:F-type H+-transporting ATPase subunit gamma